MKFNEKLIELRKKEGLSQEELGYKLDVTRQTVSKWELGQTTPEMDKLIEISKVFNTSVDELINETEKTPDECTIIEDQPIEEGKEKKNKVLIIVVGALIVVIALIVIKMCTAMSATNNENNLIGEPANQSSSVQGFFDKIFNLFDKAIDQQENMLNGNNNLNQNMIDNMEDIFENTSNKIENGISEFDVKRFNSSFEIFAGTNMGGSIINTLDKIITSNKKEERKITVKYLETETQDETQIKNIKRKIDNFGKYELTYEYDADGFINKATIENF